MIRAYYDDGYGSQDSYWLGQGLFLEVAGHRML